MNWKRFFIGFIVVYIVAQALGYLVHSLWLGDTYASLASVWRPMPEMQSMQWIMLVTSAIFTFFFCYIFVRGCEGKGIVEGVKYGLIIGLFVSLTQSYDWYVILPIPYSLALKWFLSGTATSMVMGAVFAAIYKPE